jgi:ABC-type Fe3+ transport system permease subunit
VRGAGLRGALLAAPVWVIVLIACGGPLAWILVHVLVHPHVLIEAIPDAFRLKLLERTLLYNGLAALIATALGLPVGLVLGRGRGWIARLMWILLPVSLLLPSLAYAYGWAQFFRLTGARLVPAGNADIFRCIWSIATWLWPIPAAAVGLALRRTDMQIQQQALLDGGLWRITFRQLLSTLAAAAAIAAVLAVQEFAVYEPTGISVVATETRMVFETGAFSSPNNPITAPMGGGGGLGASPGLPGGTYGGVETGDFHVSTLGERAAAGFSTLLPLLLVIGLLAAPAIYSARAAATTEDLDIGPWPRALVAGPLITLAAVLAVIIAVIIPTVSLVLSLKVHRSPAEIFDDFAPQITGSLFIAALTGAVGLALAYGVAVKRVAVPAVLGLITFLIGGQLIAIASIVIYNRASLSWLYNAPPVIVLAFLARFGWIALLAGRATWSPRYDALRDMSAVDGAGAGRTASAVIWPLAWPILLAGGLLIMALSLTEVPATLLLSPQRPPMLTPMLMTWVHMLRYDSMIEASLMLMSIVSVIGLIVAGLVGMERRRRGDRETRRRGDKETGRGAGGR